MDDLTGHEIEQLAEKYGFDINRERAAGLVADVGERLSDNLDRIYEIPVESSQHCGERSWTESTDKYNALSVECDVAPSADHSGLLEDRTVGIKDIIAVAGIPMQCGSKVMHGFVPSGDAAVTTRLRDAGAIITAKTNLDEFAGGGRGQSFRGTIRNPRDEERIAGGSSGGSAAAVAAELVDIALGTDTGGSIRKPSAFCGVVGLKPTYGLVPLTGVIENTYTLDHVGPIAKDVSNTAHVLEAIAGKDETDVASMAAAGRNDYSVGGYIEATRSAPDLNEVRIGVATQGITDEINDEVSERHRTALESLEDSGATLEEIELPYLDHTKHIKNILSYVELAAYWRARGAPIRRGGIVNTFDQVGFARRNRAANHELNDFYLSRVLAGAQLLEAHDGFYTRAHAARDVIREELVSELNSVDAIATPTSPFLAPKVNEINDPTFDYDAVNNGSPYGFGRYSKIANVTGVPAITLPNEVLPGAAVGLQLIAAPFEDANLLGVSTAVGEVLSERLS